MSEPGSGRLCLGWSSCLAQFIERSTSCLLVAECNVSLHDALALWRAGGMSLAEAADHGELKKVQKLIKDGANINEKASVSDGAGGNVAAVYFSVVTF